MSKVFNPEQNIKRGTVLFSFFADIVTFVHPSNEADTTLLDNEPPSRKDIKVKPNVHYDYRTIHTHYRINSIKSLVERSKLN